MKRIRLRLFGLVCGGCVNAVRSALEKAGAKVERINLNEAEIMAEGDVEKYVKAVRDAGYNAEVVES